MTLQSISTSQSNLEAIQQSAYGKEFTDSSEDRLQHGTYARTKENTALFARVRKLFQMQKGGD